MTVDGPRDFLWQAVPLTDPATGEVTRAFAIYRDVSALRERERALERERDRLDEFASIVSHDLRNPLQVARSHLEIARDTGGEDHFDTIERSLRRMETLLEDLLVLAREDGTVDGTEPIDIAALVETCWREDIAGNGSLDLRTDRTVMAEQSRLRHPRGRARTSLRERLLHVRGRNGLRAVHRRRNRRGPRLGGRRR